ncbi:MAG: HEAT repeat domain-containing protein [Candidatus Sumerlaeota bacterium]
MTSNFEMEHDSGGGDIREKIDELAKQVQAQPKNEKFVIQLANLYARVYLKNHETEDLKDLHKYLTRAVTLDSGKYVKQIKQILNAVGKDAMQRGDKNVLAQFKVLNDRLNEKINKPEEDVKPEAQPAPAPEPAAVEEDMDYTPSGPSEPVEVEDMVPTVDPDKIEERLAEEDREFQQPEPEWPEPELEMAPDEQKPSRDHSEMMRNAPGDIDMEMETVGETPKPDFPDDIDVEVETVKPKSAMDLSEFDMEMETVPAEEGPAEATDDGLSASAETMRDIEKLFQEEDIEALIGYYMSLPTGRGKNQIVRGMLKHLDDWRVEPLLALGAVENDDRMLRQIIRMTVKYDRKKVCDQIELESYSPDLQKIAVTVLSELGLRSALNKLQEALEIEDPVVRSVAVNGIGRAGRAAIPFIPSLVKTAKGDPNAAVRLAAAKALNVMNVREAYDALLEEAGKSHLDATVHEVLDRMEKKFEGGAVESKGKGKLSGKSASKELSAADLEAKAKAKKSMMTVVLLLALLAGLGWYGYKLYVKYNPPANIEDID